MYLYLRHKSTVHVVNVQMPYWPPSIRQSRIFAGAAMFEGLNESSIVSHAERPITRRELAVCTRSARYFRTVIQVRPKIPALLSVERERTNRKKEEVKEDRNCRIRNEDWIGRRSSIRLLHNLPRAVSFWQLSSRVFMRHVPFVTFAASFLYTRESRLRATLVTLCHQLFRLLLAPADFRIVPFVSLSIYLSSVCRYTCDGSKKFSLASLSSLGSFSLY